MNTVQWVLSWSRSEVRPMTPPTLKTYNAQLHMCLLVTYTQFVCRLPWGWIHTV